MIRLILVFTSLSLNIFFFKFPSSFKWQVTVLVLLQCIMCYVMADRSWSTILIVAYCFGGVINHSLSLAVHEIAHGQGFGCTRPTANRLLGYFANLPLGVPMSVSFKKYHLEHHRYQGDEVIDTDLPTVLEAKLFSTTFGKFIWVCLQPFFYIFRPLIVNPKVPTREEYINAAIQVVFDAIVVYFCGWRVLLYLIIGTLLAMGLHPVAGHFISEHYMFAKVSKGVLLVISSHGHSFAGFRNIFLLWTPKLGNLQRRLPQ